MIASALPNPAASRTRRIAAGLTALLAVLLLANGPANAQDWGDDSNDDWSAPPPAEPPPPAPSRARSTAYRPAPPGWSVQTGIGFTADPDTFLVNLDVPYFFNEWIAFGPAMQIGVSDKRTVVSPTGHVRITIPDLPGRALDRVRPYGIAGMGFTVIENDSGRRDGDAAVGFLIDFGAGVEYQVSEKVFLGTQMLFNVLPADVKREDFYFAWQVAGIRFDF